MKVFGTHYQTNIKQQVRAYKFPQNRNVCAQLFNVLSDETNRLYVASLSSNSSNGWLGTETVSTTYKKYIPVLMPTKISKLYIGWCAMYAVDIYGNVWANGRNLAGSLGLGAVAYTSQPTLIYS